jgi:hypothetical protein
MISIIDLVVAGSVVRLNKALDESYVVERVVGYGLTSEEDGWKAVCSVRRLGGAHEVSRQVLSEGAFDASDQVAEDIATGEYFDVVDPDDERPSCWTFVGPMTPLAKCVMDHDVRIHELQQQSSSLLHTSLAFLMAWSAFAAGVFVTLLAQTVVGPQPPSK